MLPSHLHGSPLGKSNQQYFHIAKLKLFNVHEDITQNMVQYQYNVK